MVLMAAASGHRHRRAAKSSPPADPATPLPSKVPAAKSSYAGAALHGFSFSWGTHRRLRCSKDGSPAYASPSASPSPTSQHPHTPAPDKEEQKPKPAQGDGSSSRPQRPPNLRPLCYAASSRPDGAALQSPSSAAPRLAEAPRPRKRGFAVALTKEEIARDFAAIRCGRPPRRGKKEKRKKDLQKKIDSLCPGFELAKVDLDNYIEERGLR